MSVRFRPYDPRRRFVWPFAWFGRKPGHVHWLSLHRRPPDWPALFGRALNLMLLDAAALDCRLTIGNNLGTVSWRCRRGWTTIDVELTGMSAKKQTVVRTALLKAARYTG